MLPFTALMSEITASSSCLMLPDAAGYIRELRLHHCEPSAVNPHLLGPKEKLHFQTEMSATTPQHCSACAGRSSNVERIWCSSDHFPSRLTAFVWPRRGQPLRISGAMGQQTASPGIQAATLSPRTTKIRSIHWKIGKGRTWAMVVRRRSCKSLFLLNSGHFPFEKKGNSILKFGSLNPPSKSLWHKFFPLKSY